MNPGSWFSRPPRGSRADCALKRRRDARRHSWAEQLEPRLALVAPLAITEIMYVPSGGNNFEYIEVKNTSGAPLDVTGFQFTAGITFTFPNLTLPTGGYAVVVKDQPSFVARYGGGVTIAGTFPRYFE